MQTAKGTGPLTFIHPPRMLEMKWTFALDGNDDVWVQEMISRTQSFSWIFQAFMVSTYLLRQTGARQAMRLVNFAHKKPSLETGNIRKTTYRS